MPQGQQVIKIYTDGGSRGNPGPAGAAYILTDNSGRRLAGKGFFLGQATNNIAEYTALVKALEAAQQMQAKNIVVCTDSELLARQINGEYKVKSEQIRLLFKRAVQLLEGFEKWQVKHVGRQMNKEADKLVNRAIDQQRDIEAAEQVQEAKQKHVRLGVLISGGGRTLLNILEYIKKGELNAEVAVVISSRSTVAGVERAKNAGLDVKIVRKKDYTDVEQLSKRLEEELAAAKVDLVIQAGWLCLWHIPARYEGRVMNIHPALLPSFGGQGMWGHHVHEAVLARGCKVSGCTVHLCTNEYDEGPIIVQRSCPVREDDTPDTLADRVFEQECMAYPEAIKLFAQGRLQVEAGRVKILDSSGK